MIRPFYFPDEPALLIYRQCPASLSAVRAPLCTRACRQNSLIILLNRELPAERMRPSQTSRLNGSKCEALSFSASSCIASTYVSGDAGPFARQENRCPASRGENVNRLLIEVHEISLGCRMRNVNTLLSYNLAVSSSSLLPPQTAPSYRFRTASVHCHRPMAVRYAGRSVTLPSQSFKNGSSA